MHFRYKISKYHYLTLKFITIKTQTIMKKSFLLFFIALSLFSCCDQKTKTYRVKLKLVDSSWTVVYLIEADESPDFRIDCYSYDCGQTGLHYNLNCKPIRFDRPGVIDYKIMP